MPKPLFELMDTACALLSSAQQTGSHQGEAEAAHAAALEARFETFWRFVDAVKAAAPVETPNVLMLSAHVLRAETDDVWGPVNRRKEEN